MLDSSWLTVGGWVGGILAVGQVAWAIYKDWRGGGIRAQQAETSKKILDVQQAEESIPLVGESLRLGLVGDAVAIQQSVINGLHTQLETARQHIALLETRVAERDERIDELERRLSNAEGELQSARRLLDDWRQQHP